MGHSFDVLTYSNTNSYRLHREPTPGVIKSHRNMENFVSLCLV